MSHTQLLLSTLTIQCLLMAGVWGLAGRALRVSRVPTLHWMLFCLFSGLAATLIGLGPTSAPWVAAVGNVCIIVSMVVFARGLQLFVNQRPHDGEYVALVLLASAVSAAYVAGWMPSVLRAFSAAAAASLATGVSMLRTGPALQKEFGPRLARFVTWPQGLAAAIFGYRAIHVLLFVPAAGEVAAAANTSSNLVVLGALSVLMLAFNIALGALVIIRLIERLDRLSSADALTGLPNRRLLMLRLQALHRRAAEGEPGFAAILLDLDHFKDVNDAHGHAAGDAALRSASEVFSAVLGQSLTWNPRRVADLDSAMLARLGGEEFCVLVRDPGRAGVWALAESLRSALEAATVEVDGRVLRLTTSIGVSRSRPDDASFDSVLRRADVALYRAKAAGRNRIVDDARSDDQEGAESRTAGVLEMASLAERGADHLRHVGRVQRDVDVSHAGQASWRPLPSARTAAAQADAPPWAVGAARPPPRLGSSLAALRD